MISGPLTMPRRSSWRARRRSGSRHGTTTGSGPRSCDGHIETPFGLNSDVRLPPTALVVIDGFASRSNISDKAINLPSVGKSACDDPDTRRSHRGKNPGAALATSGRLLYEPAPSQGFGSGSLRSRLARAGVRCRVPPSEDGSVAHGERRGKTRRHRFDSDRFTHKG